MGRKHGFKCSPETIQKMKDSHRKYWDKKKEIVGDGNVWRMAKHSRSIYAIINSIFNFGNNFSYLGILEFEKRKTIKN